MTTVLTSRINAGRRPAQRTMDRLLRSSIPDARVVIDYQFNILDGKEQYWRYVAKNIKHINVITPADLEKERTEKLANMARVINSDIADEIEQHRAAILTLELKIKDNQKFHHEERVWGDEAWWDKHENHLRIMRVEPFARTFNIPHAIVQKHYEALVAKHKLLFETMTQEQMDAQLLILRPTAYAEKYDLSLTCCIKRYNYLRSLEFVHKARSTDDYVKLCEQGHHAENHGQPWSRLDVEKLRLALRNDAYIVELAKSMGRTPFALLCKAIQQGFLDEKNAYKVMRSIVK